ncbi:MAG: hypothetical protein GSR86_07435 [Desulfurococcales archaeon]|nr:hypothetical protein [Desulfurococcales archaeon]
MIREAKLLLELLSKGTGLEEAAKTIGISTTRARLLVAYLAGKGLLKQAPAGCNCSTCPLKSICTLSRRAPAYVVEDK